MHFPASIVIVFFAIAGVAVAHNVPRATPTASHCDAQVFVKSFLLKKTESRTILGKLTGNKILCLMQYLRYLSQHNQGDSGYVWPQ